MCSFTPSNPEAVTELTLHSTVKSRKLRSCSRLQNQNFSWITFSIHGNFVDLCLFQETSVKWKVLFWTKVWFVSVQAAVFGFNSVHFHSADNFVLESLHKESVNSLGDLQDLTGRSPRWHSFNIVLTLLWGGDWTRDQVLWLHNQWFSNDWIHKHHWDSSGFNNLNVSLLQDDINSENSTYWHCSSLLLRLSLTTDKCLFNERKNMVGVFDLDLHVKKKKKKED